MVQHSANRSVLTRQAPNYYGSDMRSILLQIALILAIASTAVAQPSPEPKVEVQKIAPGVAVLIGQGGNIGVSYGDDGAVLVDDQFAPATPAIVAAVATLTDQPVRFVINTHWHSDHTGGNENLGKVGAVIVAHENVRKRMSTEQFMEAFQRKVPASPPAALPVVTFTGDVSLHLNGDNIQARHVDPAHTDGDSIIRFDAANVIHTGDVFVNGMYPFIDISSGGSAIGIVTAVEETLASIDDDVRIIPGHGPLATKQDLAAWAAMMRTVTDRIGKLIESGATIAAIVADKPSADFDEKYGNGFMKPDQFVTLAAQSMAPEGHPAK